MIFTVASFEGGASKTLLATHLAVWRARMGRSVLLVDLDPGGDAAYHLGLETAPKGLVEVFRAALCGGEGPPLENFLAAVPGYDALAVLCGGPDLLSEGEQASLYIELAKLSKQGEKKREEMQAAFQELFRRTLSQPAADIVFDTASRWGVLGDLAVSFSDQVLSPNTPQEHSSVDTVVEQCARHGKTLAIIPVRYMVGVTEHEQTIAAWKEQWDTMVYYDPEQDLYGLPYQDIWPRVVQAGQPIWDLVPNHLAAREMEAVLRVEGESG